MPSRSACGTPTKQLPTPPIPPRTFSTDSNSSNEEDSNLPPSLPLKDEDATTSSLTGLNSVNSSSYQNLCTIIDSTNHLSLNEIEHVEGLLLETTPELDWKISILAQKKYSAAIYAYTNERWEECRVEIERLSSATKVKKR